MGATATPPTTTLFNGMFSIMLLATSFIFGSACVRAVAASHLLFAAMLVNVLRHCRHSTGSAEEKGSNLTPVFIGACPGGTTASWRAVKRWTQLSKAAASIVKEVEWSRGRRHLLSLTGGSGVTHQASFSCMDA
jgi:hypothetical protein